MITAIQHRPLADLLRWEALQNPPHDLHTMCAWCLPRTSILNGRTSHRICKICFDRETNQRKGQSDV